MIAALGLTLLTLTAGPNPDLGSAGADEARPAPAGTVIVANMDDDSVWLIDAATGRRRASFSTHIAPHEIAVSSDGRRAAVTNYGDQRGPGNVVQLFDVARGAVTHEIEIAGYERLHGAAFMEADTLLALTSERTGEVLIVSAVDGTIHRRLETEGEASHMLSVGGPWIYTANIISGTVSRIDPDGDRPTTTWPAGTRTEGVAATPDGREGWTGSMEDGSVVGVDGATGEVVARVEGLEVPYRLAVTPDGGTIAVSDPGAGTLVLIDRSSGQVRATIDIDAAAVAAGLGAASSPQGLALSDDGAWAFVSAKGIDKVALVDLAGARVVRFFDTGPGPDGIAFSRTAGT
jgi:DNA-binding beta-propeller fold protein YncE